MEEETKKIEERDQDFSTMKIHDVVVISKHQRTDKDGKLKGYSFYKNNTIGVVMHVSETKLVIKKVDGEDEEYNTNKDKDYYYTFSQGSEVEYKNDIKKNIEKLQKAVETTNDELHKSELYLEEFVSEISLLGRIYRFMEFSKK